MKKMIGSLLRLLPIPLLMGAVSYLGDPAGLFHDVVVPLADEWGRTGETRVAGNVDDRLFQVEILRRASKGVSTLVLGSSRSMQVAQESFPGETLLNLSVAGASLQDHLALIEAAREAGLIPKNVVLNLDPWLLNRNNNQLRWKSIEPLYQRSVQRLGLGTAESTTPTDPRLYKLGQLFSPSYFQESLKGIWNARKGPTKGATFVRRILRDGSTRYPEEYSSRSVADAKAFADHYVAKRPVYAVEDFQELDPVLRLHLKTFVQSLLKDGVGVRILLAPYHPRVYTFLSGQDRYRQVQASENWFRSLAESLHLKLVGSFDPAACGMTEADFLDGMHLRETAVARLVSFPD